MKIITPFLYQEIRSRAKFTRSARRTVYLYARPKVEMIRDYQISIMADWIDNKLDR